MSLLEQSLHKNTTLTESQIRKVVTAYQPLETKHNQVLLRKGDTARNLYFVEKGYLRVFVTDASGKQFTRFVIEAGMEGTAFPSFINQTPSTASVQCVGKAEVLQISLVELQQLHRAVPAFELLYVRTIEMAYVASIHRIETLISMSARERFEQLAKEKPKWIQQLPANVIAEYLGISKETLSRLKAVR